MRQLRLSALVLCAVALFASGCPGPQPELPPGYGPIASTGGPARAFARALDAYWAAAPALVESADGVDWQPVPTEGLAEGPIVWLGPSAGGLLAFVHGGGLHRSADGRAWQLAAEPPELPLPSLVNPRGRVLPFASAVDGGTTWLAGIGGLYRSEDGGDTWVAEPVASSGALNVLFTDVLVDEGEVWAVAQLADSMLPASFAGLLGGTVFRRDADGRWDLVEDLPAVAPMAVAPGPCVGSLDGGVHCRDAGGWVARGEPFDAVDLVVTEVEGAELIAASASRGLWVWNAEGGARWVGQGPQVGFAGQRALGVDGVVRGWDEAGGWEDGTRDAGGTVHVALSFHTNYYHSYRGDSPDDDGYGQDIRVIRTILDWLDEHPGVHGDWDIENHFSLDGWMASESPDVLQRIQQRVAEGRDGVRIMSWNNGAVANQTKPEFDASIARALDSYEAAFGVRPAGVQPQENMFDPDHLAWYREHGVDWITLFYAANGFTALRQDVQLDWHELHNPLVLRDGEGSGSMTWVPVYHHADVLDHGGLAAWVRQISATTPGDSLLVVHFDADAESWEAFGAELDRLQPLLDAGTAVSTTIADYLAQHEPVGEVSVYGDTADGTGDGFQSWAEKDFNHRLATAVQQARHLADAAELRGADHALLDAALEPRLLSLSTTHFGLAAPFLHPDRVASAWSYADAANEASRAALDATAPPEPGEVLVINPRDAAGPALVEVRLPRGDDPDTLHVLLDGQPLPRSLRLEGDEAVLSTVLEVAARSTTTLRWARDDTLSAAGSLSAADAIAPIPLEPPFTECWGMRQEAELADAAPVLRDGVLLELAQLGTVRFCGEISPLTRTQQRWDGLPGTVVVVEAELGDAEPSAAESVALTPLGCPGLAGGLAWDTFGGTHRSRPMRPGVDSWNGLAAASWIELRCAEGEPIQVAPRDRHSLAFGPVRERAGRALIAPLGTLWGEGPWHDARRTGGSGIGEVAASLVGSQYRPAAPDWANQTVRYRLLVGSDLDPDVLELWAHPPVVWVGE